MTFEELTKRRESGFNSLDTVEKRRDAVNFAIANGKLEGYELDKEDLELYEKYISGELTLDEVFGAFKN
jgi:Antitoxin VbhA